ncbi:transcriptional regulator [Kitasatospora indigofera]|uniref:Transcriptional regulator n=1 Tax=Kitasatospora indigofera TaxID=67307 RepID=A0A919FE46_9ACTN|nr:helix-turn-helix transcriptional regulator [Kitasatospora indigofera]GHH62335.1 transcriptional regulator [Kitasatospora indigofera]
MPATATTLHGNARLRSALTASEHTVESLARAIGMDPRTVERWLNEPSRTPYARHALATAKLLHTDPYELWPTLGSRHKATPAPRDELLTWFPTRSAVPGDLWTRAMLTATDRIDIAVTCGLFLADTAPDLNRILTERAAAGARVRLALPDPSTAPTQAEATRLLLVEDLFADLHGRSGVRLARHAGLANDVIRADDHLLVMPKVDGCPAAAAPVLHLHRLETAPLTAAYLTGVDHVFSTAIPHISPRRLTTA